MQDIKINTGIFKDNKHYFPVHIFYNHTDAGGIVYFANYLRMTEEARVALFNILGSKDAENYKQLQQQGDFVVHSCKAKYIRSAVLNDDIVVETYVSQIAKSYITLSQNIYRNNDLLVETEYELVFVKKTSDGHRPTRVPEFWTNKLDIIKG